MLIAEAAQQAGVNVQTIRYWSIEHALSHLVHCCAASTTLECPIIDALDRPEHAV